MLVAMGIGRFVYTPILPMMMQDAGLSASQAGLIASSNYLGYLLGALSAATLRLGGSGRRQLLIALLVSVFTTMSMAWASDYVLFLGLRFLAGIASAWAMVLSSALVIQRLIAMARPAYIAVHFAGVGAGIVLASLLTALSVSAGGDWRSAWLFNGVVALLLCLIVARSIPVAEPTATAPQFTGSDSEGGAAFSRLLLAYGLFGFGYVVTATFIVQIVRSASYSLASETLVWILVGAAAAPSVWFWNTIARRIGNGRTFAIACAVEAIGVCTSVLFDHLVALSFSAILLGGTFVGITAIGLVEARARSVRDPRQSLALMTAVFGVGQIVGPGLAGYLRDSTGSFLLPTMLASGALVGAAVLAGLGGSSRGR